MEDFIMNDGLENQDEMNELELGIGMSDDAYGTTVSENENADSDADSAIGDTDPGTLGDGYGEDASYLYTEDRNGDGIEDALYMGVDYDYDGRVDYAAQYLDNDGNGSFETIVEEYDNDGDGKFDMKITSVDLTDDGVANVEEVQMDTNNSGSYDTMVQQIDENGDGNPEYVQRGQDYNDDGQFDSLRVYEDTTGDGQMDMLTEIYDSDGDGQLDRANVHYDFDGDGKNDYTEVCQYDPSTGMVTPIRDMPSYGDNIGGTFYQELDNFEPSADYPNGISGDPASSMNHWEYQGDTNRCALYSQMFIIEEFTGQDLDIVTFENEAEGQGWFDNGTTLLNLNKMLDYYGIENEMSFHNDIDDIDQCLNEGGRVIVAIDAYEIWYGQGDDLFSPTSSGNHAVEVIGIDRSDPENPMVILNDSGNPNGRGVMIPLDDFMDAWQDSEFQMVECYPNY